MSTPASWTAEPRLLAAVQLDEDVHSLVARLLKRQRLDASTAVESGLLGVSDYEQLAFAASHSRVLLTHNRDDFVRLDAAWRSSERRHAGLLIAQMQPPQEVTRRVARILDLLTADELANLLFFI